MTGVQTCALPIFPTGDVGFYSDAGYFLLGMILEKASGQKYPEFLQRRIFDPLQMTQSSTTDRRRVVKGRVATYEFADSALVNWRRDWDYDVPSFFGIGSGVATVGGTSTSRRITPTACFSSLDRNRDASQRKM